MKYKVKIESGDNVENYDVVIVGGGPAGISLAYLLLHNKINVAIIDRENFPREKLCGGLITEKTKQLYENIFQEDFSDFVTLTNEVNFVIDRKPISKIYTNKNFYFVNRYDFDFKLFQKYLNDGGVAYTGKRIKQINSIEKKIFLSDGEILEYKILVGADGANSQIRKLIDSKYAPNGLCLEVRKENENYLKNITISFGCIKEGYGWRFNKGNYTDIGYGGEYNKKISIDDFRCYLKRYYNLESKNLKIKGAFIPYGKTVRRPCKDNIILLGDAAGFVDPITGEGLYFAFQSAFIASKTIVETINVDNFQLENKYMERVKSIQDSIKEANKLKKYILNRFFQKIAFNSLKRHKNFLRFICDEVISTYNYNYDHIIINYLKYKRKNEDNTK